MIVYNIFNSTIFLSYESFYKNHESKINNKKRDFLILVTLINQNKKEISLYFKKVLFVVYYFKFIICEICIVNFICK